MAGNPKVRTASQEAARHRAYVSNLRSRYGLSMEAYERMVSDQDGKCAICGDEPERLSVDHNHDTDEIRALLCRTCNVGLGAFKDDPEMLLAAAAYLISFSDNPEKD